MDRRLLLLPLQGDVLSDSLPVLYKVPANKETVHVKPGMEYRSSSADHLFSLSGRFLPEYFEAFAFQIYSVDTDVKQHGQYRYLSGIRWHVLCQIQRQLRRLPVRRSQHLPGVTTAPSPIIFPANPSSGAGCKICLPYR